MGIGKGIQSKNNFHSSGRPWRHGTVLTNTRRKRQQQQSWW